MRRLLFLGLGHLSRGDVSIAADVARQLPRSRFKVAFIATAEVVPQLRDLGLPAIALDGGTPEVNLSIMDRVVSDFRPDTLVAADAFTLNYSVIWSGLNVRIARQRYSVPLASFDQYDWRAADYVVDFYGYRRQRFPRLLESCDLLIRNCPLSRPQAGTPGVLTATLPATGQWCSWPTPNGSTSTSTSGPARPTCGSSSRRCRGSCTATSPHSAGR
jgi:hypothetical protein